MTPKQSFPLLEKIKINQRLKRGIATPCDERNLKNL
jgi:hypothetical protein